MVACLSCCVRAIEDISMLGNQKSLFSLPDDIHYLNCASKAPLLNQAQALGVAGLRRQIVPRSLGVDEYTK